MFDHQFTISPVSGREIFGMCLLLGVTSRAMYTLPHHLLKRSQRCAAWRERMFFLHVDIKTKADEAKVLHRQLGL
jgi:hypothetical protein